MWSPLLAPTLTLLNGSAHELRGFFQELAHVSLQRNAGAVLWCDGDHGFNPHDFAELNLTRGLAADDGGARMLVKRCMTPFQWYSTLSRHLPEKIAQTEAALAIVNPFDRLWSTDELADWEAEDYVRFVVPRLDAVAKQAKVPIVLGVDMARWWRSHPVLAQATHDAVSARWSVASTGGRWRAVRDDGFVLDPWLRRRTTLMDFVEEAEQTELAQRTPVPLPAIQAPRAMPERKGDRHGPRRTRIVHPMESVTPRRGP